MLRNKKRVAYFICPHCGTVVPADSPACPECGSDSQTGWSAQMVIDEEPSPEESAPEGRRSPFAKALLKYGLTVVAAVALAAFLAYEIPIYGTFLGIALIAAAAIAVLILRGRPLFPRRLERSLERELLSISGHDPARLERLVSYEKSRKPNSSRSELLQDAIDRLLRDRTR
jgi:RNA polymerase subunit RPABC4/transcription elongation factor Spt4